MMAGQIRLFETVDGLLVEVVPADAAQRREGRRVSHMNVVIDVLWTAEEEAAANDEAVLMETQHKIEAAAADVLAKEAEQRRAEIAGRIGLTMEELELLIK